MSCTTFCIVCFYQPAFCRVCVFILWTSCLLINKWIKLNDSNRPDSRYLVTRTRLTFRKDGDSTRLESCFSQNDSVESVIFTKSLSSWWTNPVCLHTKKLVFFASVMFKIGANFLFFLSCCFMLQFEDQVSTTCTELQLRLFFHWWASRAQYVDTLSWFNEVFAYCDHGSWPHAVTLSLLQIEH